MSATDPARVAADIEQLLQSVAALDDPRVAERARELAHLIMSLYGSALSRVVEVVRADGPESAPLLERLASDPLISSLLAVHGLHPHPAEQRIRRALGAVGPALPAGINVTLLVADSDRAHVRIDGSRAGTHLHVRRAIEGAIQEAAPEIGAIHIDGLEEPLLQIVRPRAAAAAP